MAINATNYRHILPCCKVSDDEQLAPIGRLSMTGFGINIDRRVHRPLLRHDMLGFGFGLQKRLTTLSGRSGRGVRKVAAMYQQDFDMPTSLELEPITSEEQFDQILAEAQQRSEPVIIEWMASWCRKCIFLKPKLERLAAEFYPRVRFYCVNVNAVPQSLVDRAEVVINLFAREMPRILWLCSRKKVFKVGCDCGLRPARDIYLDESLLVIFRNSSYDKMNMKMPTIQLWKDRKKQAELIGGHSKAWLVVDDTREMIENSH